MPEWMRSQFMAPVYALLISLSVALALAAAMNPAPKEQVGPVGEGLTLRLLAQGVDENSRPIRVSAAGLKDSQVTVERQATLEVGEDGVIANVPADGRLKVCVTLPPGWKGLKAMPGAAPQTPCWMVDPQTGPFELEVTRS